MPAHSRIQLQVLSLYRQCLQAAKSRPGMTEHIRTEFKRNAQIGRSDIIRIEYLLRRGFRQLEMMTKSTVRSVGLFEKDK